jgi:hypothetical protein
MVFIQQKYEEALVDLYFFRAEAAWSRDQYNNRPAVDEAIAGTYWVAQQNGVTYTEEQIQTKFMEQLDAQIQPIVDGFIDTFKNVASNLEESTNDFVNALKAYYLDPNMETFENVIRVSFECEEKTDSVYLSWSEIFARIVGPISDGLTVAFVSHGRDNENKFTMAPRAVSPVEVSQAEQELVFGVAPIRPG